MPYEIACRFTLSANLRGDTLNVVQAQLPTAIVGWLTQIDSADMSGNICAAAYRNDRFKFNQLARADNNMPCANITPTFNIGYRIAEP
jgi:hypothetical protein